uniref:Uncharacterized protein n=1 Tax=Timema bartmani TaxID=61472 RepID=A0A7R9F979_9NEOP|nr:unnamed protein product [Timema bartmani]
MATTCSEGLPISPTENKSVTESVISSGSKSVSRSPSISSFNTKEDRWPSLVVSKEPKRYSRRPPAVNMYFIDFLGGDTVLPPSKEKGRDVGGMKREQGGGRGWVVRKSIDSAFFQREILRAMIHP